MNIMQVQICVWQMGAYAGHYGITKTTGAAGALFAFILLNYNGIAATSEAV